MIPALEVELFDGGAGMEKSKQVEIYVIVSVKRDYSK